MSLAVRRLEASWSGFRRAARNWIPTSVWVAFAVQTVFLIALAATDGYDVARSGEVFRVVLTYATLASIFVLLHLIVGTRSRVSLPATFFVFSLFVTVNFARFETAGSFDYGFAYENIREMATPLGRHIVTSQVKPLEIALLFIAPLGAGIALAKWPSREWPGGRRSRLATSVACLAILLGVPLLRVTTHESLAAFVTSGIRFHARAREAEASAVGEAYPLVHDFVPSEEAKALAGADAPRPHVIVLFLESWSGIYSDRARPDGRHFTPVFDERRREGLTFDHFYGNSVQSSRGRFATMCSLIPLYSGKEFKNLANANLHCLPHVLDDAGYRTLIYSASDEPEFERSQEFFGHLGFREVRFEDRANRGRDPNVWGAGLEDTLYYRKFFAMLDERIAGAPGTPLFAVGINASNHYPFNENPKHVPDPGYPTKYGRNYVASLGAQDAGLKVFFEELEKRESLRDAIVVLVGDHSFPADEHGVHFNGLGAYEESFRTAFALRWPGHVTPRIVSDRTASQIDLAPTITDLLQLRHRTQFEGRSLIAKDDGLKASPMVQPYDGIRLVAVRYPFKLESHTSAQQEHLYDLSRDPDEQEDRIDDPTLAPELNKLRETIARIHTSQSILRAGRIWPPAATADSK